MAISPCPTNVQVSIVAQTVSFRHSPELDMQATKRALEEAGFDLVDDKPISDGTVPKRMALTKNVSALSTWSLGRKKEKHAEHCMMCRSEHKGHLYDEKHGPTATITDQAALAPGKSVHFLSPATSHMSSATEVGMPSDGRLRVTMSIGGMTCSACVNTLVDVVSPVPGVSDVHINLLNHSGTFVTKSRAVVDKIVEAIEDCGYEAEIADIRPLQPTTPPTSAANTNGNDGPQNLSLSIGGMTCASCSNSITERLSQIDGVSNVVVNLLGNSATVTIADDDLVKVVLEAIDNIGYEVGERTLPTYAHKIDN